MFLYVKFWYIDCWKPSYKTFLKIGNRNLLENLFGNHIENFIEIVETFNGKIHGKLCGKLNGKLHGKLHGKPPLWHKVDKSIFQWQWSYERARALNCCCKSTDSNQSPFKISRLATNLIIGVLLHMKCWIVTKNIMNRYIWTNSYVNSYIIINFFTWQI